MEDVGSHKNKNLQDASDEQWMQLRAAKDAIKAAADSLKRGTRTRSRLSEDYQEKDLRTAELPTPYGRLFMATHLRSGAHGKFRIGILKGRLVGVKVIPLAPSTKPSALFVSAIDEVQAEMEAMLACNARIKYHGVVADKNKQYIIMDLCDGDMRDVQLHVQPMAEKMRTTLALHALEQVAQDLFECHHRGFVHADVKPMNILWRIADNERAEVLLADYGAVVPVDLKEQEEGGKADRCTPAYAAPEVLLGGPHTPASDMWGLGAMLLAVLTKADLFSSDSWGAKTEPAAERLRVVTEITQAHFNYGVWHAERCQDGSVDWEAIEGDIDDFSAVFSSAYSKHPKLAEAIVRDLMHPDPNQRLDAAGARALGTALLAENPNMSRSTLTLLRQIQTTDPKREAMKKAVKAHEDIAGVGPL